jgi:membrane protein DedA with SNARE-associated domain
MTEPVALDQPSVNARRVVLGLAVLLYAMGTFGSNIAPAWIKVRPEVVLALSARNRNLLASVPFVNPLAYAIIGFARVVFVGIVLYLVGRWFGSKALGWMEGQLGELPAIYRWARTGMDRAGWLLVVLMPGSNLVCLMAGHRKMNLRLFSAMLAIGAAGKLVVLWIGGRIFDHQIRSFLDFIDGYQWWIVGGLFLLTFLQAGNRARKQAPKVLHELEHPSPSDAAALDPSGVDVLGVPDDGNPVR